MAISPLIPRATEPTTISQAEDSSDPDQLALSGPSPQPFVVQEGELEKVLSAAFPAVARCGAGAFNLGYKASIEMMNDKGRYSVVRLPLGYAIVERSAVHQFARPAEPVQLYDRQNCPRCRIVREAVSILDLDVEFLPCPDGGTVWEASKGDGKLPVMKDPNSGFTMRGDVDEIVSYLFRMYGNRRIPLLLSLPMGMTETTASLGLNPRGTSGSVARPSKASTSTKSLRLWAYEASPFCVIVRDTLSELQLPHLQITVARGSPKRQELLDKVGHFQVPFLEDPNTGVAMFESKAIIDYLNETYGA